MSTPGALAPDYASARGEFLAAAEEAGASVSHFAHPRTGPQGEALGIDLAALGPERAPAAVLVVSGTHGVEGFAGSALQSRWLRECATERPLELRTLWLHALNPFGFAWTRRVNEDNVDLNRNFLDWREPPPANPGYDAIAELLVPESWSEESQRNSTGALLARAAEIGMERMQADVSRGQYRHASGVFYGGTGPSWSHERLHEICLDTLSRHERLAILDLHTGLGEWGEGEIIVSQPPGDPLYQRATTWWRNAHSMVDDGSVSARLMGDWLERIPHWLPETEVTGGAIEYGTTDLVSVLQALRADAWLWTHGDPEAPDAAAVRAQVRAAFADEDPAWIARLWERFHEVLGAAFQQLGPAGKS